MTVYKYCPLCGTPFSKTTQGDPYAASGGWVTYTGQIHTQQCPRCRLEIVGDQIKPPPKPLSDAASAWG